ncbi:MAG: hypothetical protein WKG07_30860 [Hymenobacter sp.]
MPSILSSTARFRQRRAGRGAGSRIYRCCPAKSTCPWCCMLYWKNNVIYRECWRIGCASGC